MLLYTLKAGGCLIAFFFCYRLLLGRDTCYRIRRILLCGMLPLSLLLPLCVVTVERELPDSGGAALPLSAVLSAVPAVDLSAEPVAELPAPRPDAAGGGGSRWGCGSFCWRCISRESACWRGVCSVMRC